MGNSKGGADAIAFSVNHPEQLALNILMGAATGPSIFDVMPPHGTSILLDIFRTPTREKVEEMMHLFLFDDAFIDDSYIDLRWAGIQEADRRGHREAILKSTGPRVNFTGELHKVPNPTLVIYGAHDRFAALDSSVSLMRHYPNSQLHVFRNCGHWAQLERWEEFNDLVISWMHYNLGWLNAA
jgi:2-hydroxy-6-oxonona-2,4-dienedioate hydrolase